MQRASERQDLERDSLEVSLMVRLVNLFAIVVPMGVHHAVAELGICDWVCHI